MLTRIGPAGAQAAEGMILEGALEGIMDQARERTENGAGAHAGLGLDGAAEVSAANQGGDRLADEHGQLAGRGGAGREEWCRQWIWRHRRHPGMRAAGRPAEVRRKTRRRGEGQVRRQKPRVRLHQGGARDRCGGRGPGPESGPRTARAWSQPSSRACPAQEHRAQGGAPTRRAGRTADKTCY